MAHTVDTPPADNALTSGATVEGLQKIWEHVFQRPSICPCENFYALGGNAPMADQLFAEVEQAFGVSLPSALIGQAPTIAALAELLKQPTVPLSPILQIKPGGSEPPVFIAHGLSGMVEFYKLARCIPTANPIYGIQARGLDGRQEPFDRIDDMAKFYLDALTGSFPDGPYLLMGYSFGGLVALEMAQQLLARGRPVQLLVLIDAYPHPRFMPADQRWRLALRRVGRHAGRMLELPFSSASTYLIRGLQRKLHLSPPAVPERLNDARPLSFAATMPAVNHLAYRAYANYRPQFYRGPIKFITTTVKTFFPGDPGIIWNRLAEDLEVVTIPGDHLNIVTAECQPLADAITSFLHANMTHSRK